MFYMNVPTTGTLSHDSVDAENGILLPQDRMAYEVRPSRTFKRVLFDPQLYLASLEAAQSPGTCARLATYPWFKVPGSIDYESGGVISKKEYPGLMKQIVSNRWTSRAPDDVEGASREAIVFQATLPCDQIILPAPLVTNVADACQAQAAWLDAGLKVASG